MLESDKVRRISDKRNAEAKSSIKPKEKSSPMLLKKTRGEVRARSGQIVN